jgi:hypothetical protein
VADVLSAPGYVNLCDRLAEFDVGQRMHGYINALWVAVFLAPFGVFDAPHMHDYQ